MTIKIHLDRDATKAFFSANEAASKEEVRYYLNGVHLELEGQEGWLRMTATNGTTLVSYLRPCMIEAESGAFDSFTVPRQQIEDFKRPFPDTLTIIKDGMNVSLESGGVMSTKNCVDGVFPAWRDVIPPRADFLHEHAGMSAGLGMSLKMLKSIEAVMKPFKCKAFHIRVQPAASAPCAVYFEDMDKDDVFLAMQSRQLFIWGELYPEEKKGDKKNEANEDN